MSVGQFIEAAKNQYARIGYLKECSKPWPEIFTHNEKEYLALSTLVRIFRDGKYYLVHLIQDHYFREQDPQIMRDAAHINLLQLIVRQAHGIQQLYIITPPMQSIEGLKEMQDLDPDQTPEPERVKKLFNI